MKLNKLASKPNLELAWRRITTGGNYQYKQYYRQLYYAYEVALDANLNDLRQRLIGGAFQPQQPSRIYITKPSGLHRPLTLLNIEDQIVLQAFANLAARKMYEKRSPLQLTTVFSNIHKNSESIFFFRDWKSTYAEFEKRINQNYTKGMRWVGDFDLAAFYDTISHELLLSTIYPRTKNDDLTWFEGCLKVWSSDQAISGHGHGLPQGPIASDYLAECFLLPIDIALKGTHGYARYVDDVRLFGSTESEVRSHLIELERRCRERGLIPQTGKFAIRRVQSIEEALGMLPSFSDPQHERTDGEKIPMPETRSIFMSALSGRPYRVADKTRLRYVLFRALPDSELLKIVLRLIPRHPEHADVFFIYLNRFNYRRPVERLCLDLVEKSPYAFIRGEAWHVLARYLREPKSITAMKSKPLIDRAIRIAKRHQKEHLTEIWGACHFLCVSAEVSSKKHENWLRYQDPLIQALVAPALPDSAFRASGVVKTYLARTTPEPGLSVVSGLHERGLAPATFGLDADKLPSQVANALHELGVINSPGPTVDPIAEVLMFRYGTPRGKSWHALLGNEYVHALGLLKQAEATFVTGRSFWLTCQNSFNQVIFLALQHYFHATNHPAACTIFNRNGDLVDFGTTLTVTGPFSRQLPIAGACFRDMNARRNTVPPAHPYTRRNAVQTQHLGAKERDRLVSRLRLAYQEFVQHMP